VALEALRTSKVSQFSRAHHVLRVLGWHLDAGRIGYAQRLKEALGDRIWGALDSQTRDYLVLAEELHELVSERRLRDYGSVAVVYRQAIEGEWRTRIGSKILELKSYDEAWKIHDPERLTLGAMISAVQYAPAARLSTVLGQFPQLSNREKVQRCRDLVGLLNRGAHDRLTAADLSRLRQTLFDDGMLSVVLGSVVKVP